LLSVTDALESAFEIRAALPWYVADRAKRRKIPLVQAIVLVLF
jgi:hypothetical protein